MVVLLGPQSDNRIHQLLTVRHTRSENLTEVLVLLLLGLFFLLYYIVILTFTTSPAADLAKLHLSFHLGNLLPLLDDGETGTL